MGKLLVILLFLGAAIGVYQGFREYKEKQYQANNIWPEKLTPILANHVSKKILDGTSLGGEKTFFQLMWSIHQIERDGYPVSSNLTQAATTAGATSSEATLIARALVDNYQRGLQLGVFDDPVNLVKMERGEAPVAKAPGWEEEPIAVGFLLSPMFGRELALTLPNMVLMPEALRNMQTDRIPPDGNKTYMQWLTLRMIVPSTGNAIRLKIEEELSEP